MRTVGYGVMVNIAASHGNLIVGIPGGALVYSAGAEALACCWRRPGVPTIGFFARIAAARGSIPRIRILFRCFELSTDSTRAGQCFNVLKQLKTAYSVAVSVGTPQASAPEVWKSKYSAFDN
jgi:hypothetical protein